MLRSWDGAKGFFSHSFLPFEPSIFQEDLCPSIPQTQLPFQPNHFPDVSCTCHDLPSSASLWDYPFTENARSFLSTYQILLVLQLNSNLIVSMSWALSYLIDLHWAPSGQSLISQIFILPLPCSKCWDKTWQDYLRPLLSWHFIGKQALASKSTVIYSRISSCILLYL